MQLTRKRDLRTGQAVWRAYRHARLEHSSLRRSTRADVVVVGAGISGALVSHALTDLGMRPLIVDRRGPALGSTAASTALLQFELDTPLLHLARKIGTRAAERAWLCSHAAVNSLRTKARKLALAANLVTRPSLYLAGSLLDANGLRREVRARQKIGLPSEMLERKALRMHFELRRAGAILSHGNAEADPVGLAAGFLCHALRGGARLHAPHEIVDVHCGARATTLLAKDGIEISARHVVLCTGYELPKIVPRGDHQIRSTWAIATGPQSDHLWPERALLWEASEPYLYVRASHDGRVICGGEDEDFADETRRDALIARKAATLERNLARLLPHVDARHDYAWTGTFGSSRTGLPSVGQIPGYRRCYAVQGYGGNGITFSMLAAQILVGQIRGKRDADARLFEFR